MRFKQAKELGEGANALLAAPVPGVAEHRDQGACVFHSHHSPGKFVFEAAAVDELFDEIHRKVFVMVFHL